MLEPNSDGPKCTNKYLVEWYKNAQWNRMHFDTLGLAFCMIKALEYRNLVWKLSPIEI